MNERQAKHIRQSKSGDSETYIRFKCNTFTVTIRKSEAHSHSAVCRLGTSAVHFIIYLNEPTVSL